MSSLRFMAKSEAGQGWRIWNRKANQWWGEAYRQYPEQLLAELNGQKRPERLIELAKEMPRKRD